MNTNTIRELLRKSASVAFVMSVVAFPALASEVTGNLSTGVGSSNLEGVVIAAPTFSPAAGTYSSTRSVSLTATGSLSIRYTVNGDVPTCASTLYAGEFSVSSTKTVKAISCYANGVTSSVSSALYTISSGGGGGGGGASGTPSTPVETPVVTPPVTTPVVTPTPSTSAAPVSVLIHDPSKLAELLAAMGATENPAEAAKYKALVKSDALEFNIGLTDAQIDAITNFITYGASSETKKLGAGERRAVIRDYFQTVGRADVVWDDIQRLTTGQKPIKRNLANEQAQVDRVLANFKLIVGHQPPNFKDAAEDMAWNTMMYRIRFPRDLVKEVVGINKFKKIYNRDPKTPLEWSIVRALGYVLK